MNGEMEDDDGGGAGGGWTLGNLQGTSVLPMSVTIHPTRKTPTPGIRGRNSSVFAESDFVYYCSIMLITTNVLLISPG